MASDLEEAAAVARELPASMPAGSAVTLDVRGVRIALTAPPASASTRSPAVTGIIAAAEGDEPARHAVREPLEGCGRDILDILRACNVRLTAPQLLDEMADRGLEHSSRSVDRHLALLRQAGLVDHDSHAKPPGYGPVARH
jgi:hypothetical protein